MFSSSITRLSKITKKTPKNEIQEILSELSNEIHDNMKDQQAYIVLNLIEVLSQRFQDSPDIYEFSYDLCKYIIDNVTVQIFPKVAAILFRISNNTSKWKIKVGSLDLINYFIEKVEKFDRDLLSASLCDLIPEFGNFIHDTKKEVSESSIRALNNAMKGITNKDIEPFIPHIINAMINPEQNEETIQKLGGVVFVQTIESSALSVIVPLMETGLRHNKYDINRLSARIVSNMAKLVEDPVEAKPFLDTLIDSMAHCKETISHPEVREVVSSTHATLLNIDNQAKRALQSEGTKYRNGDNVYHYIKNIGSKTVFEYKFISCLISSLILTKTVDKDEYYNELTQFLPNDEIEKVHTLALSAINISYDDDEDTDDTNLLCNCEFTLAYGTKVLLRNTKLKLQKGSKYGLLGQNDCGKTTLMRAIANGTIDGFPDQDTIRTVFVEADIQGELSHLNCVDYVLNSPSISNSDIQESDVRTMLKKVGFSEGKSSGSGGDCDDPISSLSGGWRMKLALARAMLQKADIILMDEPTNHLDVKNVKWVKNYINSLKETTVVMVSHDSGLLEDCCNYILQIESLKLKLHKGNLSEFVKNHPEAQSYFEFKANKYKFTFPKPSFLEGIKSRGKVLLKMDDVTFTYPGNTKPTINNITIRASMSSRVACVGVNGAGKSTMIKVLTGQLEPSKGSVWKYPNSKIGYIAQHAFHHIESHLDKTPNEYIRWRYAFGNDREGLDRASMRLSDEEQDELLKPIEYKFKSSDGKMKSEKRVIYKCTGQRRESEKNKKTFEYEVQWRDKSYEHNSWFSESELVKFNSLYQKVVNIINQKIEAQENVLRQPLTSENVERHLKETGLESEYATHFRIGALSGGQKVKVVLAASMWDQPHILILDEPTNYLDRDSLGALADAISNYDGGVIMITHNDAFCRQLCPERWVLEAGYLNTEGDVDWMDKAAKQEVEFEQLDEIVDASGNEVKLNKKKKLSAKEKKKLVNRIKKKIADGEDLDSDEENIAIEYNL